MCRDEHSHESEVSFPAMRHELQYAVRSLADEGFQASAWSRNMPLGEQFSYSFDMAFHTLLDDSIVADQGAAAIGTILKDDRELASVQELIVAAQRLIGEIGLRGTYEDARSRKSWATTVEKAKRTRAVLGDPPAFP